jgi:hypothetical protein
MTGGVDAQFGDQHFKTAISLIELHKIRTGGYPESLKDLKFTEIGTPSPLGQSNITASTPDTS